MEPRRAWESKTLAVPAWRSGRSVCAVPSRPAELAPCPGQMATCGKLQDCLWPCLWHQLCCTRHESAAESTSRDESINRLTLTAEWPCAKLGVCSLWGFCSISSMDSRQQTKVNFLCGPAGSMQPVSHVHCGWQFSLGRAGTTSPVK